MISIPRVGPEEADLLTKIAISAKGYWNYPQHWKELWIPQLTFSPAYFEGNESWAAELKAEAIAFYTLQERAGGVWLENIWVSPQYIGQGVGKELFSHALSRSRELGYTILQLVAEPNAVGYYEKMGMRNVGEDRYELDGQLRVLPIMEMDL